MPVDFKWWEVSKKNQNLAVVKAIKTDFIQDNCDRGKETSV